MAVQWADFPSASHGLYGPGGTDASDLLDGLYAEIKSATGSHVASALVADPDANIGSAGVVAFTNAATSSSGEASESFRRVLLSEQTTAGMAQRWWLSKLPSDTNFYPFLSFRTNANADILHMRVTTTGQLAVYSGGNQDGGGGTLLGTTTGPVITANAWTHIEVKCTKGAGTGAVEIKVEGVSFLALTGLTLSASNIAQVVWGCHEGGGGTDTAMGLYVKEVICWDTSGSYANDFLGSQGVFWLPIDADDTLGGWTTSTGVTGYPLLDDAPANDADYIQADDSPPAAAVFEFEDLPPDITSVTALLPIARMLKTDGGDCTVQMSLLSAAANDPGADRPITTAFTYWWDVSHTDPNTSAPWTPPAVDAATLEINRTL